MHEVIDFGFDEIDENFNTAFRGRLEFDGCAPDASHGLADKLVVDFSGVLFEFSECLVDGVLRGQHNENIEFFHLDVDGIIVAAEEDLDLAEQDTRPFLTDELNVAQRHKLILGLP